MVTAPVHESGLSEFLWLAPEYFSERLKVYVQYWDNLLIMMPMHIRVH